MSENHRDPRTYLGELVVITARVLLGFALVATAVATAEPASAQEPERHTVDCAWDDDAPPVELRVRALNPEERGFPRAVRIVRGAAAQDDDAEACVFGIPWSQAEDATFELSGLPGGAFVAELGGGRVLRREFLFEVDSARSGHQFRYRLLSELQWCEVREACSEVLRGHPELSGDADVEEQIRLFGFRLAFALAVRSMESPLATCLGEDEDVAATMFEEMNLAVVREADCPMADVPSGFDDSCRTGPERRVARLLSSRRVQELARDVYSVDVGYSQGMRNAAGWTCIVGKEGSTLVPIRCDLYLIA